MAYNKWDHFYRKAKDKGFRARSVFKLEDLDKKYRLFKPGQFIIDLGSAPGSWSQYIVQRIAPSGRCLGIDLEPLDEPISGLEFHQGDFLECDWEPLLKGQKPDGVVSDMAPNTSGIRDADQARSLELCESAFEFTERQLSPGGFFVCKIFEGPDTKALENKLKKCFRQVTRERPEAVRASSKEFYFLCRQRLI